MIEPQVWKLPVTVLLRSRQDAIEGYILVEGDPMKTLTVPASVWQRPHSAGPVFFLLWQERSGSSWAFTINADEIMAIAAHNSKATLYEN